MKNAPKITALLCTALLACGAMSASAQTVPGWPDYLAMGAIGGPNGVPTSPTNGDNDNFVNKPVDVVFKYAGANGNGDPGVVDPPINALRMTDDLTYLSGVNGRAMRVAIVEYMAQMSNGFDPVDFTNTSTPSTTGATYLMARHFISLAADAIALNDYPVVYNSQNYYGTLILNPDLLGEIQVGGQITAVNNALSAGAVTLAVKQALCFLTNSRSYAYNSVTYNGTPVSILKQLITTGNYPRWQVNDASDPFWGTGLNNQINNVNGNYSQVGTWFNGCAVANPSYNTSTYQVPSFPAGFEGWVQANNWLIRTFSPQGNVTFGWQDNMWAVSTGYWVHADLTDNQIASTYSTPLSDWLETNAPSTVKTGDLGATYKPDYFVFDRYETDDSDYERNGIPAATLYNARSWDNYIKAVGQVSARFSNIPVMLWQLPGSHIPNTAEANSQLKGGVAGHYIFSTAPVYFFGDVNVGANLANMRTGTASSSNTAAETAVGNFELNCAANVYNCGSGVTTYKQHLLRYQGQANNFDWSQDNGKRELAVANNVFAILWGGGSTTNVIKNFSNTDDNGWLAGKIITYYASPTPLAAPPPAPTVTSVSPTSGPVGGGTAVTITGTNLTDTTAVKFGTTSGTLMTTSATSVTVTSPAHAAGSVDVTVTTPDGTSATGAATKFLYIDSSPPTVSQVLPSAGSSAGGTTVTITGTHFTGVTGVTFSGVAGTSLHFVNSTQITVKTPAHTQGGSAVRVTTSSGATDNSTDGLYTFLNPATITSVTPASGPIAGGTHITIKGTNLDSGTFQVTIDGTSVAFTVVNSTTITATTPQHLAGAVSLAVSTAAGTVTKANAFTYVAKPTITAINPNQGPAKGGTMVTIVGTHLNGATRVKFGTTTATSFSASSSTHATAIAPAHAAGVVNVTLTTPGGISAVANGNKFTYTPTPALKTIAKFVGGKNDGSKPVGGLVSDSAGALYGTTSQGGKSGLGTIFKLTPSGSNFTKSILYHFDATHGATPFAGLVIDSSKNLYGATTAGGNKNKGVIFKYTASTKKLTVLHNFQGTAADGGVPYATLARDSSGLLYGATTTGGSKGKGTTFTFKEPSTFKVTHHFVGGADGANAQGAMLLDAGKNVYGTTIAGGTPNKGAVYKIAPNGARTILHSFATANTDGHQPRGGLFMKGNALYGTTSTGGASNKGAVFKIMPPSTAAPLLFTFTGTNGANPYAGVIGDTATVLYGTTFNGGATNLGTVFKLLPPANGEKAWSQSVMVAFKGGANEGASPAAPVLLGKNKTLYGTTNGGGSSACAGGCGTVFKVTY